MAIFLLENIYEGNVYMGTCITFKNTTELFSKVHLKLIQNCKSTILQLKKKSFGQGEELSGVATIK